MRTGAAVGAGFSVLGEGDLDADELVAGTLGVRAGIVQSSALTLAPVAIAAAFQALHAARSGPAVSETSVEKRRGCPA